MRRNRIRGPWTSRLLHSWRVGSVVALLLLIPPQPRPTPGDSSEPPPIEEIQAILPAARSLEMVDDQADRWGVKDEIGRPIGSVVRTLPAAQHIVGYRGPTEAVIVLDDELNIAGVRMLHSADTAEHVEAVRRDKKFFAQFQGWPWGGPGPKLAMDGVSGATLTSLALAEGVLKRIDGKLSSLLFPHAISIAEVQAWFPEAHAIDESSTVASVQAANGRELGLVMRTGPLCDDVTGYRGPSELLMKLNDELQVEAIHIRSSFDNQPFTDYVRDEAGFWAIFAGQTLDELAAFRPEAAGVEGVSGATMTSLAVADTIVAAAQQAQVNRAAERAKANARTRFLGLRWTATDLATGVILLLAAVAARRHWFRDQALRKVWLLTVICVIGLWGGNLISLALISGWAGEGVAWQLAPGLAAVAAWALIAPPINGANPYCHHLCPHGALQQLIKPPRTAKWKLRPPRSLVPWLQRIPPLTLVAAYIAVLVVPTLDLSSWEPFHAYLIRLAPGSAFALALGTLALSALIPMGYCRFGCPTGSLLDYLRRSARSGRLQYGDIVAASLLALAAILRW